VVPLLLAVAVIGSAALVSAALGLSLGAVLAVTAVVAVTGAVIAHRTVRSLSAGVALLLIRPYAPGERVRLHSAAHGGLVEAEVVRIGLANTTLATDTGLLVVPNHRLLHGVPDK
jgi:small-conductance mechanosensitive channel